MKVRGTFASKLFNVRIVVPFSTSVHARNDQDLSLRKLTRHCAVSRSFNPNDYFTAAGFDFLFFLFFFFTIVAGYLGIMLRYKLQLRYVSCKFVIFNGHITVIKTGNVIERLITTMRVFSYRLSGQFRRTGC